MSSLNYNVAGEERKKLVRAVSDILGEDAVYLGAPTFAYTVDFCTISKDGTLIFPDPAPVEVDMLYYELRQRGYAPVLILEDVRRFTVELPRDGFSEKAYGNLQRIIASKASLLKKALGTDTLEVKVTDDALRFPWFTLHDLDGEADAYTRLVTALCKMAKERKRVTAKEREVSNDKFTMRLFLIRLGFIGPEYQAARAILLRSLTGSSAWKNGTPPNREPVRTSPAAVPGERTGGVPYEK